MRKWIPLGVLVVVCGSLAMGADAQRAIDQFRQAYAGVEFHVQGGQLTRVYGTTFGAGESPEIVADNFVLANADMFGVVAGDLVPGNTFNGQYTQPMMYEPASGTYKFTLVYYHQVKDGIPVYGSDLRLVVRNEPHHPLVLAASSLRDLGAFQVPVGAAQTMDEPAAIGAALKLVPSLTSFGDSEVVIWAGANDQQASPAVAITFVADNYQAGTNQPERWRFVADAASGEILYKENLILFTDVTGSVRGMATEGDKSDTCANEVSTPMAWATVSIQGGNTAYADANGNFTIPYSGSSMVTVQSPMSGHYFTVSNSAGSTEALSMAVLPPGPANFVHNSANTLETVRSQVNAYVQANVVRDWVLVQNPSYPTIAGQTGFALYVNRSDNYCPGNAWYDGSSLNFCSSSSPYPNTAYSSVVHHEYGHHIAGMGGSGQDQYGEGLGDSVAVLLADNPILGYGFEGNCSAGIRTADNTMQYPCTSDIHTCAQLLSGCIWSTRNQLIVTEPANYLSILSDLMVNSVLVHSGGSITPQICTDFLVLDDNDGDLSNGTPHYNEITTGFGAHNMCAGPPPENDNCADAVPACPGAYSGTTVGMTNDGSAGCGSSNSSPDVWYKYTPATSGTLSLDLCSSDYDTVLSVHNGCPGTSGNQVACNDNTSWFGVCGFLPTSQSALSVSVTAGHTYLIRISGNNVTGNYVLNVSGPACVPNYTLTVNVTGQGSVALTPPGGSYPSGTTVQLAANAVNGWHFDHWEGALTGSANPASLLMNGNKTVTAVFVQNQYALTVNVTGQGTVALDPPGGTYSHGTTVQLTANAAGGWQFDHWSGALNGPANPTTILMDGPKSVTAVFVLAPVVCRGDGNCDGTVNWRDIDYFVAAMSSQAAWESMFAPGTPTCQYASNDADASGTVDWRDIDPFVALMGTVCP